MEHESFNIKLGPTLQGKTTTEPIKYKLEFLATKFLNLFFKIETSMPHVTEMHIIDSKLETVYLSLNLLKSLARYPTTNITEAQILVNNSAFKDTRIVHSALYQNTLFCFEILNSLLINFRVQNPTDIGYNSFVAINCTFLSTKLDNYQELIFQKALVGIIQNCKFKIYAKVCEESCAVKFVAASGPLMHGI